uniref:Prolamin-like domain-containing protein n=1 Tax=Kalanchoe fedtschenkoi TaxID=63787 RepID=A0A7N0UC15_KALFE
MAMTRNIIKYLFLSMVASLVMIPVKSDNVDDPLADAPTIDYERAPFYPPIYNEPDVILSPNDIDFPPSFKTKNQVLEFLRNCENSIHLSTSCGMDYHSSVFIKDLKPADACCKILVKEGKLCHDLTVRYILRYSRFHYNREASLKRSDNVWKHCSIVANK